MQAHISKLSQNLAQCHRESEILESRTLRRDSIDSDSHEQNRAGGIADCSH